MMTMDEPSDKFKQALSQVNQEQAEYERQRRLKLLEEEERQARLQREAILAKQREEERLRNEEAEKRK